MANQSLVEPGRDEHLSTSPAGAPMTFSCICTISATNAPTHIVPDLAAVSQIQSRAYFTSYDDKADG